MADDKDIKILVAEDEPSVRRLICFKLKKEDFIVDEVEDGQEAMKKLRSESYDVLILDLMLPMLDGLQILKKINKENIDIAVLILSAKSQEKDITRGFELGADDYITKPFKPQELIIRLKKLLN
ncbi:response regulator transcription factor [Halarsenatibacter silvermanii]|uniref:Stage 0 sporulation protein A homolog n=1 Tax=Halarsenatibacter silvermanii TaxID=321763 RepID=A0A1G9M4T2_9FIRM|nr:response regulator [Halarsenatibacter silvermanii]SDL69269.1 Response regulator receiver domain-containing protein [Halarsenatibacter silvermanii]